MSLAPGTFGYSGIPTRVGVTAKVRSLPGRWLGAVALAAVALALVELSMVWPFTVDDAYITLRYSRNLITGVGPTFNAMGPRAEGYTSGLWTLLLTLPSLIGAVPVSAAKLLAVLATFATFGVMAAWAKREDGLQAAFVAIAVYGAMASTPVHAVSGMETALFSLVLTATLATAGDVIRGAESTTRLTLLASLAGLTRPEGNLVAAVTLSVVWLSISRARRPRLAWSALVLWVAPIATYQLWRWNYYGLPFPLPWYVKVAAPSGLAGWPDVASWFAGHALPLALFLCPVVLRPARSLLPAFASLVALAVALLLPQHLMGYEYRYLTPLDPILGVMAGVGAARILAFSRAKRLEERFRGAPSALLLAATCALLLADVPSAVREARAYAHGLASAHEQLGRDLSALDMPEGRLALSDAGAIPYLSNWWTLDLVGLNTARIATSGLRDPDAVLAERPDVIVLVSRDPERFVAYQWNTWEVPIYAAARASGFSRVALKLFDEHYWLWVLAKPQSRAGRALGGGD